MKLARATRSMLSPGILRISSSEYPRCTRLPRIRETLGILPAPARPPYGYDRIFFLDSRKGHGKRPLRLRSNTTESDEQVSRLLEVLAASGIDAELEQQISLDANLVPTELGY